MVVRNRFHVDYNKPYLTTKFVSGPLLDIAPEECRKNLKPIHITITSQCLSSRKNNKVTDTTP